jgi:hypothetical protein
MIFLSRMKEHDGKRKQSNTNWTRGLPPPAKKGKTAAQIASEIGSGISEVQVKAVMAKTRFGGAQDKTAEMAELAKAVAKFGISHNPDLDSEATANRYIQKKILEAAQIKDKTRREIALAKWQNYVVDFEDLDNDISTPENLLIRSRVNPNDVYSVDGYRLSSKAPHITQRGIYDTFPTRDDRVKFSQYLPEYKRYLRKYLTPEKRMAFPFNAERALEMQHSITVAE